MDDPQQLSANAALASALVALFALALSIIGLVQSKSASKDAQVAREKASNAQWKMSEHLEAIAASLTGGMAPSASMGGQLTARLVRRERGERLVIANVGTHPLRIGDVAVDPPNVLVGDMLQELQGSELLPGEDQTVPAVLTFGTRLPLRVTLRWTDLDGQPHEREQLVNLSD
jgi:hypothetical protein